MKKQIFAVAILAFFFSSTSFAQPFQKNGLPCLKEICIGDGLPELAKIQWERSFDRMSVLEKRPKLIADNKVSAVVRTSVRENFLGNENDILAIVPYLSANAFDGVALPKLSGILATCREETLTGMFMSQSGRKTEVDLRLMPTADGAEQKWTVVKIVRLFPENLTNEQKQDLANQVQKEYINFPLTNQDAFAVFDYGLPPKVVLRKQENNHSGQVDNLRRKHALCGTKGSMSIN